MTAMKMAIKLSDARSRSGSQRAAERQRLLSSRDRPSFAAVATAGMCQTRTLANYSISSRLVPATWGISRPTAYKNLQADRQRNCRDGRQASLHAAPCAWNCPS